MEYAFFEGDFVPIESANINIKTNSFHYGTAIFEGLRAYWNDREEQLYILFAREHYDRLLRNAGALFMELPYSVEDLVSITRELLIKNGIKQDVYISTRRRVSGLRFPPGGGTMTTPYLPGGRSQELT